MDDRSTLIEIIREKSYKEGDFTLTSGKKSSYMVDLKPTALSPEGASCIGRLVVEKVKELGLEIDGVGGMTLGADPLVTCVSLAGLEGGYHWPALIVRKEPKSHGTSVYIEGTENLKKGSKVLVLEDVTTTGGSSVKASRRIEDQGYKVAGVLTIVDREEGGAARYQSEGIPFYSLFTVNELRN